MRLALYILYYSSMRLARAISNAYKLMDGSIYKRWSSHEDELCVVNLPSSEDLIIAVDFQRFTDYHPEEILDVNKRRDLNCDLLHRRRERYRMIRATDDSRTRWFAQLLFFGTWFAQCLWMIRTMDDSRTRWFAQIVIYYNFIIEFITDAAYICDPVLLLTFVAPAWNGVTLVVCRPTLVGVCYPISYIVVTVTYFGYLLGPNEFSVICLRMIQTPCANHLEPSFSSGWFAQTSWMINRFARIIWKAFLRTVYYRNRM